MKNDDFALMRADKQEERSDEKHESGNFSTGLIMGLFAGVAGMFLFGTKKGQKTVDHWKKEWERVKPKVEEELETAGHKLEKTQKPFFQALGEIVEYVAEKLDTPEAKKRGAGKTAEMGKKKKRVFFK